MGCVVRCHIRDGDDPIFGQIRLEIRRWRTTDGKVELFLQVASGHIPHLLKTPWFIPVDHATLEPPLSSPAGSPDAAGEI